MVGQGVDLRGSPASGPADAVVLAVPHQFYIDGGWPMLAGCLKDGKGLVIDIRSRPTVRDGPAALASGAFSCV
jgi:UDP-N-acetyl-D-galactosamine dehydrogenase